MTAEVQPSRRAFLLGTMGGTAPANILRPPGSAGERAFQDACTGCGACIDACPDGIIAKDSHNYPLVDFDKAACSFCAACIDACPEPALTQQAPWLWRAHADTSCLSIKGVQCRICQDHCDQGAIRFQLQLGGRATPEFASESCTGCGACIAPCPVDAIEMRRLPDERQARPW